MVFRQLGVMLCVLSAVFVAQGQMISSSSGGVIKPSGPQVISPTQRGILPAPVSPSVGKARPSVIKSYSEPKSLYSSAGIHGVYPWRRNITATVFWIGEHAEGNNPVPNYQSSWDTAWQENFGGFDNPDPAQRTMDYCPRAFRPLLNPFYVALPYNDCMRGKKHKPEASRVVPWFQRDVVEPGVSVCKGKWVQIFYRGKYCFAQWEDCGPFNTEDWSYVFGNTPPMNFSNKGAGIDISPAVRDYLGVRSGEKVHWRFVELHRIPRGPWSRYGSNNPFVQRQPSPAELRRQIQLNRYSALKAGVGNKK